MSNQKTSKKNKSKKNLIIVFAILVLFIGVPLAVLKYQASKSGLSISEVIKRKTGGSGQESFDSDAAQKTSSESVPFLKSQPIGLPISDNPQISNVETCDLNNDGLLDVLVCDTKDNTVSWIKQSPMGQYTEQVLASDLIAPAHIQAIDFDGDGDKDLMIAVLGMLFPNNDKIGSIVVLENTGDETFTKHIIAEKIARVSDVRGGDLDGDGDMDLAAVQFGYDDGETRWVENLGNWKFESHIIQNMSGPINIEITDIDNDGDLDMVSLVSQEWEEIYAFVNDGKGNFQPKLLWGSSNEDYGSSGIAIADINQDGKPDILYTNGDAFDYVPPVPRAWHGVQWLENKGNLEFEFHRICTFPGAFSARATDIDHDNDMDIFVVSGFNLWDKPDAQSFIWLENDGKNEFTMHNIANAPTHMLTMELGDFNNDGEMDMVSGGMHVYPPFDRLGRITLWMNDGGLVK